MATCTFVALGDDLTPPRLVLLLADILVKQTICAGGGDEGIKLKLFNGLQLGKNYINEAKTFYKPQSTKSTCGKAAILMINTVGLSGPVSMWSLERGFSDLNTSNNMLPTGFNMLLTPPVATRTDLSHQIIKCCAGVTLVWKG